MGGEYNTRTYEGKLSREEVIQNVLDTTYQMNWEDGSGSYSGHWGVKNGGVDFCSTTFKTESEADTWLCDNNDKWGNVGACYFDNEAGTKAQRTRVDKLNTKLNDLESKHTVLIRGVKLIRENMLKTIKGVKSKTKGCKSCGARHIVKDLNSLTCNCGATLMSDTQLKKVENAETRSRTNTANSYKKVQKETQALRELKDTLGIKQGWLCGGWCSC